jgi:hypothetical protein
MTGLHLYTKYLEAVIVRKFLPLTMNVENLAKSVNRKGMSNRPEIESQGMGSRGNVVHKYQVAVISSCLEKKIRKLPTIHH